MSDIKPALLKVREAAHYLSLSEWEIRRLCSIGVLERRYVGDGARFYRVTTKSLDRYVASLSADPVEAR